MTSVHAKPGQSFDHVRGPDIDGGHIIAVEPKAHSVYAFKASDFKNRLPRQVDHFMQLNNSPVGHFSRFCSFTGFRTEATQNVSVKKSASVPVQHAIHFGNNADRNVEAAEWEGITLDRTRGSLPARLGAVKPPFVWHITHFVLNFIKLRHWRLFFRKSPATRMAGRRGNARCVRCGSRRTGTIPWLQYVPAYRP